MTKLLRRLLGQVIAGFLAVVLGAGIAAACSCVDLGVDEQTEMADVVVRAVVEEVERPGEEWSGDPVVHRASVSHVWKGDVGATLEFSSAASGAACGLDWIAEGDEVVLFAQAEGDGWTSSLCSGTALVTEELVADVTAVLGDPLEPTLGVGSTPEVDGGLAPGSLGLAFVTVVGLSVLGLGLALFLRRRQG